MIVVADSGPLHYLVLCGAIEALPALFGTVHVPETVVRELTVDAAPALVRHWLEAKPAWLRVSDPLRLRDDLNLDPGETAAISLACELRANLLLLDDRDGRMAAIRLGLQPVGTVGVIELAASRSLLDFNKVIGQLLETNIYLSPRLVAEVRARAALS